MDPFRTTAVFCRPTCPARKPLPENVECFPTARAALFAGHRPCKRCRPLEPDDRPEWSAAVRAEVERDPASRITDADRTNGLNRIAIVIPCHRVIDKNGGLGGYGGGLPRKQYLIDLERSGGRERT